MKAEKADTKKISKTVGVLALSLWFSLFGQDIESFAASGNVSINSAVISADGQSVSVSVKYIVTSDDVPEAEVTYYTNGCYKECFSPTRNYSSSCNTKKYAYFKRTTDLDGSFDGSTDVESVWCPGGYDDLGTYKTLNEILRIPDGYSGDGTITATYYLEDVAGYGCQLYYGQIYSCSTSTPHPDYHDVFASATLTLQLCDGGQSFCCVDGDGDGFYAISDGCAGGGDCDDSDPVIYPGNTEVCDDSKDNDCNGFVDCEDTACIEQPNCIDEDILPNDFTRDCNLENH